MDEKTEVAIKDNQFFQIEGKGRQGLQKIIELEGENLWASRPAFLANEKKEAYFKKMILAIANNDNLKPLTQSRTGLFTLYQKMAQAVTLGLNLGGVRPHAHITAFLRKNGDYEAALIPTADGYRYVISKSGAALFKDVLCNPVFENDTIEIDTAQGQVIHKPQLKQERGNFIGCYVLIKSMDVADNVAVWISRGEIDNVRDKHSSGYMAFKAGKISSTPWETDYLEMAKKTAIKKALKPYISQCEGLANLVEIEADSFASGGVAERAAERLDKAQITPGPAIPKEPAQGGQKVQDSSRLF